MSDLKDFVIENGVLKEYKGNGGDVIVPDGVSEIEWRAFSDNSSIVSVILPNSVTKIQARAFSHCTSLVSITFPKTLTKIEEATFLGCTSLTAIVIPCGITEIKDLAFCGCSDISTITIPDSLVTVWKQTFKNCNQLNTIIASSKKTYDIAWKVLTNKQKQIILRKIILEKSINDTTLHKIKTNKNILIHFAIENNDVELLSQLFSLFQKVDIETLDKSIAAAANSPQVISFLMDYKQKHYTFEKLEKEENHKIEKSLGIREKTIADWKKIYIFEKCRGGIVINNYKGDDDYVVIPKAIGKYKVVAIGYAAFSPDAQRLSDASKKLRESITTILIPDSVKRIDSIAFSGCKTLASITLPKNITEIEMFAFRKCTSLTSISIPSCVKKLGYGAFYKCTSLASITIPESVETIDMCAFEDCFNLTIHAPAGSYAEQYAKENNIPFVAE